MNNAYLCGHVEIEQQLTAIRRYQLQASYKFRHASGLEISILPSRDYGFKV